VIGNYRILQRPKRTKVIAYGLAEKYLHKGSLVYVECEIKARSYQDKEGKTGYVTEVVADSYSVIG